MIEIKLVLIPKKILAYNLAIMGDPQSLKEEGNGFFKTGNYKEALRCYTEALSAGTIKDSEKAVIYKNRAAVRLKLNDNLAAVDDCSACKCLNFEA